jgi:hypothetical protein
MENQSFIADLGAWASIKYEFHNLEPVISESIPQSTPLSLYTATLYKVCTKLYCSRKTRSRRIWQSAEFGRKLASELRRGSFDVCARTCQPIVSARATRV